MNDQTFEDAFLDFLEKHIQHCSLRAEETQAFDVFTHRIALLAYQTAQNEFVRLLKKRDEKNNLTVSA